MEKVKKVIKNTWFYRFYLKRKHAQSSQKEVKLNKKTRGPIVGKFLPKGCIGAELGVLKGNFSKILFSYTEPKELHLIDPWYFLDSEWSWADGNQSTIDALCKVLQENKKEINERKIFVHVQDDLKVLENFPDRYFDWVYIDSSHTYEHTKAELNVLLKKVKIEGIIGGDDWRPDSGHRHHGVFKAVMEFIKLHDYELIYADEKNLQWFIKKRTD